MANVETISTGAPATPCPEHGTSALSLTKERRPRPWHDQNKQHVLIEHTCTQCHRPLGWTHISPGGRHTSGPFDCQNPEILHIFDALDHSLRRNQSYSASIGMGLTTQIISWLVNCLVTQEAWAISHTISCLILITISISLGYYEQLRIQRRKPVPPARTRRATQTGAGNNPRPGPQTGPHST